MLTGYVTAEAMDILTRSARALVFPSLYEGFGMPVIEAMQRGVPVAAAWTSSLPEVVNGAALLFDPHSADTMARAIGRVMADETLRTRLVERGHLRATTAGTLATMTDRYEACFERALATPRRQGPVQVGIFSDAWMGRSATFATHPRHYCHVASTAAQCDWRFTQTQLHCRAN